MDIFFHWLQELIKHWIKPAVSSLPAVLLSDITRSCTDLMAENAMPNFDRKTIT
jgi:hypothetical protein